jgi:hypothetical protein
MSFRELTQEDMRDWRHSSPIGVLEFFPDGEEPPVDQLELSGRRVAIRLHTIPADPLKIGDLLIVEVIAAPRMIGVCRACGCDEGCARDGGFYFVEPDLCSKCAPRAHPGLTPEDARPSAIQVTSEADLKVQLAQARRVGEMFRGLTEKR